MCCMLLVSFLVFHWKTSCTFNLIYFYMLIVVYIYSIIIAMISKRKAFCFVAIMVEVFGYEASVN